MIDIKLVTVFTVTVEDHENVYICTVSQPRFEPDTNRNQVQFKPNVFIDCLLDIA
jgi:hypothetical protein